MKLWRNCVVVVGVVGWCSATAAAVVVVDYVDDYDSPISGCYRCRC